MGASHKNHLLHWSVEKDQGKFLDLIHKLPPSLLRFVKFCLVGGSGVLVDMTVLYILADPSRLGWDITLSKICAAEIAMISNFTWNELWTFRLSDSQSLIPNSRSSPFRRFLLFNAICGIGIGLAVLLLHSFHTYLGWNLYLSNLLAISLVTLWNYTMNSRLCWLGKPKAPEKR